MERRRLIGLAIAGASHDASRGAPASRACRCTRAGRRPGCSAAWSGSRARSWRTWSRSTARRRCCARLSDPFWFQAFGCVLGFDWHSSGVTTTVCGALKEAVRGPPGRLRPVRRRRQGRRHRARRRPRSRPPARAWRVTPAPLVKASRLAAKVDNTAVQDGHQLYHHSFVFTPTGSWCVVQQGMSDVTRTRAPLSLAERRAHELRRRAARRGVLRCARRAAEHGRDRERGGARGRDRAGRAAAGGAALAVRAGAEPVHAHAPSGRARRRRSRAPAPGPAQDLRAAARGFREPARDCGSRPEEPARAGAHRRGDLRRPRRARAIRRASPSRTAARTARPSRSTARPTRSTIEVLHDALRRAKVDRSERISALKRLAAFARRPGAPAGAAPEHAAARSTPLAIGS